MFKIKYRFLFVYNMVFNSIGFMLLFPFEAGGAPFCLDDMFPADIPALVERADEFYLKYKRAEAVIKDSSPWRRTWILAEYELEEARVNRVARIAGLSPWLVKNERRQGKGWGEICLERMLSPAISGLGMDGPNEPVRANNWFLWKCYYSPCSYTLHRLKQNFSGYGYTRPQPGFQPGKAGYWEALLSGDCQGITAESRVDSFKGKVVPPRLLGFAGKELDLTYFCAEYYQAKEAMEAQSMGGNKEYNQATFNLLNLEHLPTSRPDLCH